MAYLKLLEVFVLSVLMDKTEYNFFHKNFKPLRVIAISILVGNLFFTFYLVSVLNKTHQLLEQSCPQIFEIAKAKSKKT